MLTKLAVVKHGGVTVLQGLISRRLKINTELHFHDHQKKKWKINKVIKPPVKELFFGEANSFASQAFEASAQRQMLVLQALHGRFAYLALLGRQTGLVGLLGVGDPARHLPAGGAQDG